MALLEIDLQGARQVRERDARGAVRVPRAAVAGTSWSAGWSAGAPRPRRSASARLATARDELAAEPEFDVTIVNDDVRRASEELVSLMRRVQRADLAPPDRRRPVHDPRRTPTDEETPTVSGTAGRPRGHHQPADRRPADRGRLASTPWSSTPPSAPARSTPTTPSSTRACSSTSARSSRPTVHEKPLSIALREINEGLLTSDADRVLSPPGTRGPGPSRRARRPRRQRRHRGLQGLPAAAADHRGRPRRHRRPHRGGAAVRRRAHVGGPVRQAGRHRRLDRRPRGAARAARAAGRPRRRRPRHGRPAGARRRTGWPTTC